MKRLAICLICFFAACSSQPRTSESLAQSDLVVTDIRTAPVEYQLAYSDSSNLPRGNDADAARIRYFLNILTQKTGDSEKVIADMTARCTRLLKKDYGKVVSNQRFLEDADDYFAAGGKKVKFEELGSLLVMREVP